MKNITFKFVTLSIILTSFVTFARDFTNPHQFTPGDVLSADMMNDLFSNIESSAVSLSEGDLVGSWSCESYIHYQSGYSDWQSDASLLMMSLQSTVDFSMVDGEYRMISTFPNPFYLGLDEAVDSEYLVNGDLLFFQMGPSYGPNAYLIRKISSSRFSFYRDDDSNRYTTLYCDLQNLPPINPKQLSATISSTTVSLTWQDDSDDESSFKIIRKDSLTGDYAEIGTASANATTYTDTLTTEGKYWYRVIATNDNGDSVGSNVVKVTYGDDTESLKNELRMLRERMEVIESEL